MKPYYEQDGIVIYHGDFRVLLPLISFDAVVTDPPYGTGQKIAYDVYRDTMPEWLAVMKALLSIEKPMAFTMSHSRLLDLEEASAVGRLLGQGVHGRDYTRRRLTIMGADLLL